MRHESEDEEYSSESDQSSDVSKQSGVDEKYVMTTTRSNLANNLNGTISICNVNVASDRVSGNGQLMCCGAINSEVSMNDTMMLNDIVAKVDVIAEM